MDPNDLKTLEMYYEAGYKRKSKDTMIKLVRRIDQEEQVTNETFSQIFEKMPVAPQPFDFYEQQYMLSLGQQLPQEPKFDFKKQIQEAEDKLNQLNREYENLKNRKFTVRRGRNNRIFCKSFAKTIYDFDTQDESNPGEDIANINQMVGKKR